MLNCSVPPLPVNDPREMEPPLTWQFVQVLFTMARAPVGADGVVHVPGEVLPTRVVPLLHPFVESTLA